MTDNARSCAWPGIDPLMQRYHDEEWGVPSHDDRKQFEFLVLEGAQAGLSWRTILNKREAYRKAYLGFHPQRVADFGKREIRRLLNDAGIVRNRLKVESSIRNARLFLKIQEEFGTFNTYIWRFVDGKPKRNAWRTLTPLPCRSPESDVLSKDLIKRGFSFAGSTIIYAHMQAVGMVNDHIVNCFRYRQVGR